MLIAWFVLVFMILIWLIFIFLQFLKHFQSLFFQNFLFDG